MKPNRNGGLLAFSLVVSGAFTGVKAEYITHVVPLADAVVIGTVQSRLESDYTVSFDIHVVRVLKGNPGPIPHIEHVWNRSVIVNPTATPHPVIETVTGVWMLKQAEGSNFDAIRLGIFDGAIYALFWPATVALPPRYKYDPNLTPLPDQLVYEIGAGFKSLPRSNPDFFLSATRGINSAAETAVLQDFASSPSTDFQLVALEGLLARGQSGIITTLQQSLPRLAANPQAKSVVLRALKDSFRSTDPAAVQQLAALASSGAASLDFRAAAISALVAIHTREALPFLASLLQSQDPDERMKGVFGISSFANNLPAQTPENFKTLAFITIPASGPYQTKQTIANFWFGRSTDPAKEQELVTFWRMWWTEHPELH